MGDYPLGRATVYDDLSGSPAWMHEVLNAGHIGLWTIILEPTTGEGQMLANDAMLRVGRASFADRVLCPLVFPYRSRGRDRGSGNRAGHDRHRPTA